MSHRIEKINSLLRSEIAEFIEREVHLENGLITVSQVECSPDLKLAKISVSILPENLTGTALKNLKRSSRMLTNKLKKKLNLKYIPKLSWIVDPRESHAAKIEEILKKI